MTEMMAAEIEKLIERLERLTGPDREADVRVWSWLTKRNLEEKLIRWLLSEGEIEEDYGRAAKKGLNCDIMVEVPHYTSSIDAALTLVPEGHSTTFHTSAKKTQALCKVRGETVYWSEQQGEHKTPAIALCIAALRALSHKGASND